jgi:MATE family multidrug resistance protein
VIRREDLRLTLLMAVPVVLTQLGNIAMTTVDTIMVGRLGPQAMSAAGLGHGIGIFTLIIGMGILLGIDPIVSQAFGAHRWTDCGRAMRHGLLLAVCLTLPIMFVLSQSRRILALLGQDPAVAAQAATFLDVLNYSTFPFLGFAALRSFLQGIGIVTPALVVVWLANLVNLGANYMLVFGHGGAPALGIVGSAWSTTLSRWLMFFGLAAYVFLRRALRRYGVVAPRGKLDTQLIRRILQLGGPVGMQLGMEIGLFTAALVMMGWLGTVPLAGHQIALNLCSITFMVPLGFSATAAVRVGQAIGRNDVAGARRAAFAAYACGLTFMAVAGATFALFPEFLARIYSRDAAVVAMGASLLLIGAAFQIFDGGQTIGIGALRGAADTRVPMLTTILGYWGIGLPLGYLLGFHFGLGPRGVWWGLSAALFCVAVALGWRFHHRVREERLLLLKAS